MIDKKRGLGRGLQDLLSTSDWLKRDDIKLFYCPLDRLVPNPYQPRQTIDDSHLHDLAASIKEKGVLQPIIVTASDTPDHYQILAGERRWRASRLAGLEQVPVLLRDSSPAEVLELALIENIQRHDLNCIEEALAYNRLQDEFSLTQEEIAQKVGKDRSTIANHLRLLQLPADIQEHVLNARITMGHARALLALRSPDEQRRITELILAKHLSVRQTEQLISQSPEARPRPAQPAPLPPHPMQQLLQERIGAPVTVQQKGQRGIITIQFKSQDDLHRIMQYLGIEPSPQPSPSLQEDHT